MEKEFKHNPEALNDEVKITPISFYRKRNTTDRVYNKLGHLWDRSNTNK